MLASQQVLERVAALLVAANVVPPGQVHTDRLHPVSVYPSIKVVHAGEDLLADEDGDDVTFPARRLHELQAEVHVFAQAVSGMDAVLASRVAAVLLALEGTVAATTLQPLVGCSLKATGLRYGLPADAQAAHGQATVRLEISYRTHSNDPETLI